MVAEIEILYLGAIILLFILLLFRFSEKAKQKRLRTLIAQKHLKKLVPKSSLTQRNLKLLLIALALISVSYTHLTLPTN